MLLVDAVDDVIGQPIIHFRSEYKAVYAGQSVRLQHLVQSFKLSSQRLLFLEELLQIERAMLDAGQDLGPSLLGVPHEYNK